MARALAIVALSALPKPCQRCVEGAGGGIAASDRQAIKQHILSLMLQAPKQVQVRRRHRLCHMYNVLCYIIYIV